MDSQYHSDVVISVSVTWFSSELGSAELMSGLHDLKGLFSTQLIL